MELYLRDIYPANGAQETSTEVIPDPDEQDALGEDRAVAEATKDTWAGSNKILIAAIVIVCIIIFFGAA